MELWTALLFSGISTAFVLIVILARKNKKWDSSSISIFGMILFVVFLLLHIIVVMIFEPASERVLSFEEIKYYLVEDYGIFSEAAFISASPEGWFNSYDYLIPCESIRDGCPAVWPERFRIVKDIPEDGGLYVIIALTEPLKPRIPSEGGIR